MPLVRSTVTPICLALLLAFIALRLPDGAAAGAALASVAVAAFTMFGTARRSRVFAAIAVVSALSAGLYVSADVSANSMQRTSAVIIAAALLARTLFLVVAADPRRWAHILTLHVDVVLVLCAAVRLSTLSGGSDGFASGRLLGSVQAGEFTRVAVVVAMCSAFPAVLTNLSLVRDQITDPRKWFRRGPVRTAVLFFANIGVLGAAADLGPTVLVVLAVGLAVQGTANAQWRQWLVIGAVLAVAASFILQFKGGDRVALLVDHDNPQVQAAWDAAYRGGLFGTGNSAVLQAIPAVASDYMPAAVIATFGSVPSAALFVALFAAIVAVVVDADAAPMDRRHVAMGAATTLMLLIAWTIGSNTSILPLSGLSAPFLVPSASAISTSMLTLALARGFSVHTYLDPPRPPTRMGMALQHSRRSVVLAAVVLAVVSMTWIAPDGLSRSTAMEMERARVITSDGIVIAETDAEGNRIYPGAPGLFQDIAFSAMAGVGNGYRAWRGIESTRALDLTCGATPDLSDDITEFMRPMPCVGQDVVSSVVGAIQSASRDALGNLEGQIAAVDAKSGRVLALVDSTNTGPDRLEENYVEGTRHTAGGDTRPEFPASTMKIVTGAMGDLLDIPTEGAPLDLVELPGGGTVENADGFKCPDTSIETMLAFSCNTSASEIALNAGAETFRDFATEYFGFDSPVVTAGQPNTIDGGWYSPPTLGLPNAGTTSSADLATSSFGMGGVRANILNLAQIGAVVANPDVLTPAPRLVAGICEDGEFHPIEPESSTVNSTPLPAEVVETLLNGMASAVTRGTATELASTGRTVVAKTGTADVSVGDTEVEDTTLVAIVNNRIAIAVRVANSTAAMDATAVGARLIESLPSNLEFDPTCAAATSVSAR